MWYSDSEHVKKKQSYSDFPFALNLFVWWQFQGSTSCPPIHLYLTHLSCCVRENTHENYGRVYNLNQWFLPNLEDRFLQSCPVGKVDWDFPDLRKSSVFFFFYWPKYVLPYSLLASFLIQLDLKKKKKKLFCWTSGKQIPFAHRTHHILRNVLSGNKNTATSNKEIVTCCTLSKLHNR